MKKLSKKYFMLTTREVTLFGFLCLLVLGVAAFSIIDSNRRTRDAERIQDIRSIRTALEDYYSEHQQYPECLYKVQGCAVSLEGSSQMPVVPHDPLTGSNFSYSAHLKNGSCQTFHIGSSLERKNSQALLTGADAPPSGSPLCKGSEPDFSGISYAKGGEPCNEVAGIAQPTDDIKGETCYDLTNRSR